MSGSSSGATAMTCPLLADTRNRRSPGAYAEGEPPPAAWVWSLRAEQELLLRTGPGSRSQNHSHTRCVRGSIGLSVVIRGKSLSGSNQGRRHKNGRGRRSSKRLALADESTRRDGDSERAAARRFGSIRGAQGTL